MYNKEEEIKKHLAKPIEIGDKVKIGQFDNTWLGYDLKLEQYIGKVGIVKELPEYMSEKFFGLDNSDGWCFPISCAILQPWDKQDFLNTKIIMIPEQSEKLQKYLFSLGFTGWQLEEMRKIEHPCLYIDASMVVIFRDNDAPEYYYTHFYKEIKFEDIIFNEKFEKEYKNYLFEEALKSNESEQQLSLEDKKKWDNYFATCKGKTHFTIPNVKEYTFDHSTKEISEKDLLKQTTSEFGKLYNEYKVEVGGELGFKDTNGKMYYELDWQFIQDLAERMFKNKVENGGKYERDNWKKTLSTQELENSIDRHYMKMKLGQTDEDHEIAIVANLMMLRYLKRNK